MFGRDEADQLLRRRFPRMTDALARQLQVSEHLEGRFVHVVAAIGSPGEVI